MSSADLIDRAFEDLSHSLRVLLEANYQANRGLLMTHRKLLTEVWGPEYGDATSLLRTHIANLRGKLRRGDERARFIRTDSGIGYRFSG